MSNSFGLKISDIKNSALQKLAWTCDKDGVKGYLSTEEYTIFKEKAIYIDNVSDEDFNQAMGLYKSESSNNEGVKNTEVVAEKPEATPEPKTENQENVQNAEETANTEETSENDILAKLAGVLEHLEGEEETTVAEGEEEISDEGEKEAPEAKDEQEAPESQGKEETPENGDDIEAKVLKMVKRSEAGAIAISSIAGPATANGSDSFLNDIYKAGESASGTSGIGLQDFANDVAAEVHKIEEDQKTAEMHRKHVSISKNGTKTTLYHAMNFSGMGKRDKVLQNATNDDSTTDATSTETTNQQNNNNGNLKGIAQFSYSLRGDVYNPKKPNNGTNFALQANCGIEGLDEVFALNHKWQTKNGGMGKVTVAQRLSSQPKELELDCAVAFDYKKDDFSAGAFAHVDYTSHKEAGNVLDINAEAFANYKDMVSGKIGISKDPECTIPKLELSAYGGKAFDNGLSIAGSVSANAQYVGTSVENDGQSTPIRIIAGSANAKGNLTFTSGDKLKAEVDGILVYSIGRDFVAKEITTHDFGAIVKGSFTYSRTKFYTNVCLFTDLTDKDHFVDAVTTVGVQLNNIGADGLGFYVEGKFDNLDKVANNNKNSVRGLSAGVRYNF